MMDVVRSDLLLQGLMLLATIAFATVMRVVFKSDKEIAILLMQGLLLASSSVVILTALDSRIFSSAINQRLIMVIPAMMTLIYLGRDVFHSFSARHRDDK